MRAFVTGANGFIGRQVCDRLAKRGIVVTRAVRTAASCSSNANTIVTGDLEEHTGLAEVLRDVDVIVHLAGRAHVLRESAADPTAAFRRANVEASVCLAEAAVAAGVRRFVFISSIGVFGDSSSRPLTEDDPPGPLEAYALSKYQAELALQAIAARSGLQLVIVRPPLVYGPGCPGNFARLARLVRSGIPLPFRALDSKRSLLGVRNLASFIDCCVTHPAAEGETFVIADGEDVSLPELIGHLARGLGVPLRLFDAPEVLLRGIATLFGKRLIFEKLTASLRVDATKARDRLNWLDEVSLADGLHEAAVSFARSL
jgi:nucleoside-diphosphate-sugar epimerase